MKTSETKTERDKEETEAERVRGREGVYLQGRGGGTPMSAKSGSEERAEEGWGHSFLIHDYKIRIFAKAKTTRYNNVLRNWIILASFLSLKLLTCWTCYLLSCQKVQTCGKKMSWVWDSSLEPPLMYDHYAVWRHLCTTFFQKSFYPITYLSHKPQPRRHILTSAW